jgi:hypothetical protein
MAYKVAGTCRDHERPAVQHDEWQSVLCQPEAAKPDKIAEPMISARHYRHFYSRRMNITNLC